MITLCMDTSHIFLVLVVYQDNTCLAQIEKPCWKRQSEEIFPCLEQLLSDANITQEDIDQVVITKGPGSYTGIRIAMTIAKVICRLKEIPLFTIGTLELYAGTEPMTRVLLDARGKRAYTGVFDQGKAIEPVHIQAIEEMNVSSLENVIGDGHLVGKEDCYPDFAKHFIACKDLWKKEENVDVVVPEYLKEIEAYRTDGTA